MKLNTNKCVVHSITLKRKSSFHDYNILGTAVKRVTDHDYLDVTMSCDRNWLDHAKIKAKLVEPLVYLKEPYPPIHKM